MNPAPNLGPRVNAVDVESLEQFDSLVAQGSASMQGWHVQSVDLTGRAEALRRLEPSGSIFLGCDFSDGVEEHLRSGGALVFPDLPDTPFDAYRGGLYTAAELYSGLESEPYEQTLDARVYAWSTRPGTARNLNATLASALHDHAIGDALDDLFDSGGPAAGRDVVGVMGGHGVVRGTPEYDDGARLGRLLAQSGVMVATGGGPGAMEAANLGAYLSSASGEDHTAAVAALAGTPGFQPSITDWARSANAVLARHPQGTANIGIPTWFYGHEPPNLFATHIAKYFTNSVREAVLLQRCSGGIVFLPGAAGTVQEIFQDACENYYAADTAVTPMILVGRDYWTNVLPAWPVLQALARNRAMARSIQCVDTVDEVLQILAQTTGALDGGN
ncbi:LOG family protein [Arthrobacter monumenti]